MDFTSRKLVRRARIRRNHERQVRVAAVKSRKRTLQSSDTLEQLLEQEDLDLDKYSKNTYSTQSTIPSLPSLSGSQYLTATSTSSKRTSNGLLSGKNDASLQSQAAAPNVPTPYPGQLNGGSLGGLGSKPRQRRARGTKRSDPFDDSVSDSYIPTEASRRRGYSYCGTEDKYYQSGHVSDSAVLAQRQEADLTVQPRKKHGRVRPQGADVKRKRVRQLEKLKQYNSKIETVLEEEVVQEQSGKEDSEKTQQKGQTTAGNVEMKQQPFFANNIPSNPPSPALSRMVRQKTESLNISETTLQQIKEMSSHLRIVNWLWDSTQLPLQGEKKARSCKAASPGAATTMTSNSDNLVVVRRGSGANWFDMPRVNHQEACRQEQMSPVSINSDFKSDYEDELMSLV